MANHEYTLREVRELHDLPLPELMFRAQTVHREHHKQPKLSWIELKEYVEDAPAARGKFLFRPRRDIRLESPTA